MTQVFPYPEPPEEPESDRTLDSSTGTAPQAQPPAEPPASEEASQTLISGPSPDFNPASPFTTEPEEDPNQTLLSSRPAQGAEEPTEWVPASEAPGVGAPLESPVENLPVGDPEAPFEAVREETLPEGGITGPSAADWSEPAPQTTPVDSAPPVESAPPIGSVPPVGSAQSIASTPPRPAAPPLSPEDERTWSMISHLTMLLNLVTGFLGPVAALIIYLYYKDRSRLVAFHAMQSFVFQLVTWIGGGLLIGAIWVVTGLLSAILIGLLCIPFAALLTIPLAALPVVGLVYAVVGAIQVNSGQPFSYWLVGDWVRGMID